MVALYVGFKVNSFAGGIRVGLKAGDVAVFVDRGRVGYADGQCLGIVTLSAFVADSITDESKASILVVPLDSGMVAFCCQFAGLFGFQDPMVFA